MSNIVYIDGDLVKANEKIRIQPVNCRGAMGKGLALEFKNLYPDIETEYKELCKFLAPEQLLGMVNIFEVKDGEEYIINCFTQNFYGTTRKHTDDRAVRKCMKKVREFAKLSESPVAIPYGMCCGTGGGDWRDILKIIEEELYDIEIHIYRIDEKISISENSNLQKLTEGYIIEKTKFNSNGKIGVVIFGGRNFARYNALEHRVLEVLKIEGIDLNDVEIYCGKAKGADSQGELFGKNNKITVREFQPRWKDLTVANCVIKEGEYGKYNALAGHNRNEEMAEDCYIGIGFWDEESSGTKDMRDRLRRKNKKCYMFGYNGKFLEKF